MTDITSFLNARLDEDEAAAKVWQPPVSREDFTHWQHVGRRNVRYDNGRDEPLQAIDVRGTLVDWCEAIWVKWDIAGERCAYIARFDPDRTFRDVAADRKLVAAYEDEPEFSDPWIGLDLAVRIRAERFSDHPDFRQEWKP